MLNELERNAARSALAHRDIAWIADLVPARYRDNPKVIREILASAVTGDPSLADKQSYILAHEAVTRWQGVQDLYDRAARLYHDPKIRAEFGDDQVEAAWRNPEKAYRYLIQAGAENGIADKNVAQEILEVIGGARELAKEIHVDFQGQSEAVPSLPNNSSDQEREYHKLIKKSLDGPLSAADQARLARLAEGQAGREEYAQAAERAAALAPQAARRGEYEKLIEKSNTGALTAADQARLVALAGQRAVDQGRVTADDLEAETALDEGNAADWAALDRLATTRSAEPRFVEDDGC